MDYIFIQPVSMQVTREQYKQDLKDSLLKLGYKECIIFNWGNERDYLATNYAKDHNKISVVSECSKMDNSRYFIDHYNPQLFLAIAAMTKGEIPIVREWFVYTDYVVERAGYKVGVLYKNENPLINARWKRKATLQELIDKFKKQEEIMETKELIENLKPLIAPENMEKFNKLMGIEKPMFRKEDFITGDKVVTRDGNIYLVIRDCNAGTHKNQTFVLLECVISGGFMSESRYDSKLCNVAQYSKYDIMKIYRWKEGAIGNNFLSIDLTGYTLIWNRD